MKKKIALIALLVFVLLGAMKYINISDVSADSCSDYDDDNQPSWCM
jgi:hypothetical protein